MQQSVGCAIHDRGSAPGTLCQVPPSCTSETLARSDEMLYSANADGLKDEPAKDDEEEDEEMERPARAVSGEISPRASSPSAAAAASSDPANISPASTPRLRVVPDAQRRAQVQECHSERVIRGAIHLPALQQGPHAGSRC